MEIQIKNLRRQFDGSPGNHLMVNIGDETQVIIDTSSKNAIFTSQTAIPSTKFGWTVKGDVLDVMKNDIRMPEQ